VILGFFRKVQPRFHSMINDSSKFGMAKSIFMLGRSAGFDMTSEEETQKFAALYNSGMPTQRQDQEVPYSTQPLSAGSHRKQLKRIERLFSQSRKKGRKKGR
jgi:hypothetical protein